MAQEKRSPAHVPSAANTSSDKKGSKAQLGEAGQGSNRGAGFSCGPIGPIACHRLHVQIPDTNPPNVSIVDHSHASATVREA